MTGIDYAVIAVYLLGVAALGIRMSGRQASATDYFLGGRDLPWWAVSFSVVATETSTLTVIGIPAVAYGGSLTFFQLTFGYILGRVLVAWLFLPRYLSGSMRTAYEFLGDRFGAGVRSLASGTFLITRLLADGVRLFATAIPVRVMLLSAGLDVGYPVIIGTIAVVTTVYTLIGGLKAVVWVDVVQMILYLGGAAFALVLLSGQLPAGWWESAREAGKLVTIDGGEGLLSWLLSPYVFPTAVIGGAIFSMASHGTDHLIVQRLLACRTLADSRRALIMSGFVVMAQFAAFLAVGLLLWGYYEGATLEALGLSRGDEVFPKFIVEGMPPGISGLLLAGIIAAAMSTLSSSLNALASSTVFDILGWVRRDRSPLDADSELRISRWATLGWGLVFIVFANLFRDQQNPVVELGLAIASFTYGGLLGAFLLGMWNDRPRAADAGVALVGSVILMTLIIFGVWYGPEGWTWAFRPDAAALGLRSIAWPWYTAIGAALTLGIGSLTALRHR
ncbi:MAG: sodium:solute symporter [Rhodothermales bacterium]|nr:sodium:solute symporter [Rhodothermales bacterium]MBO6781525.1 sodium:solute symporter [Rhodothermales bacterium]